MEPRDIKKLGLSRFSTNVDFNEPAMSAGQEGHEDYVEKSKAVKPARTLLQKKRHLLQVAAANADSLSNADIKKLAAALLK